MLLGGYPELYAEKLSANCMMRVAVKSMTGKEYSCMIEDETRFMGFPHLYYPSNPAFAEQFVKKAEKYRRMEQKKA